MFLHSRSRVSTSVKAGIRGHLTVDAAGRRGRSAGGLNDESRSFPKDEASTIGVEVIRESRQIPDRFDTGIESDSPHDTECAVVERVKEHKPVEQSGHFEMDRPGGKPWDRRRSWQPSPDSG